MMNFSEYATAVNNDDRLYSLMARYDNDPESLTESELDELVRSSINLMDESFFGPTIYDDDSDDVDNDYDYDYNDDMLEMGYDPFEGDYTYDC